MKELRIEAKTSNLDSVLGFIDKEIENTGCSMKTQMQIDVAVEELFVNIANYAYPDSAGEVCIGVDVTDDPMTVTLVLKDSGIPYDPLAKEDPDVKAALEDRQIGGLGIYMAKNSMDSMSYEYKDDQNILTMSKRLSD